jgi:hypothetical protein
MPMAFEIRERGQTIIFLGNVMAVCQSAFNRQRDESLCRLAYSAGAEILEAVSEQLLRLHPLLAYRAED